MPDGGEAVNTVAEALLADLARRGTRRIWGVPGGGSSLDLLANMARFGIGFVLAKHEGAAAMAAILGGGGGKVMAPAWVTVAPRITSSSMFCTRTPSFFGVRSASMWRMLLE
jgi:thiamine pyrophosphate-dependent acetolactate synthase large subunit-like protein